MSPPKDVTRLSGIQAVQTLPNSTHIARMWAIERFWSAFTAKTRPTLRLGSGCDARLIAPERRRGNGNGHFIVGRLSAALVPRERPREGRVDRVGIGGSR